MRLNILPKPVVVRDEVFPDKCAALQVQLTSIFGHNADRNQMDTFAILVKLSVIPVLHLAPLSWIVVPVYTSNVVVNPACNELVGLDCSAYTTGPVPSNLVVVSAPLISIINIFTVAGMVTHTTSTAP